MSRLDISVLCDFDGTITLIDTAEYILDKFAKGDWRGIERRLEKGELSIEQTMKLQFEMISMSRAEMVEALDRVVQPRPSFESLLDLCSSRSGKLLVTSAGLDFYIQHFMEINHWDDRTEVIAPRVTEDGDEVKFEFPAKRYPSARNFKEDEVLRAQAGGRKVAYIGDGTSDLWAALRSDLAFAVEGSKLDALLRKEGKGHITFTDFRTVVDRLAQL